MTWDESSVICVWLVGQLLVGLRIGTPTRLRMILYIVCYTISLSFCFHIVKLWSSESFPVLPVTVLRENLCGKKRSQNVVGGGLRIVGKNNEIICPCVRISIVHLGLPIKRNFSIFLQNYVWYLAFECCKWFIIKGSGTWQWGRFVDFFCINRFGKGP